VRFCPPSAKLPFIESPTELQPNVINIINDGSKIGGTVGAAAAVIIRDDTVLHQSKYRVNDRSFNIQAEHVTILRSLEQIKIYC